MPSAFQAVALDYDGTVTTAPRPRERVLTAVRQAREGGRVVVLVTGRILAELRADFPEVEQHFDAVVAENGAVLSRRGAVRDLAAPVDPRLGLALARHDIPVRHGRVLLACDAAHDAAVLVETTRLGLDYQLMRNRGALMVLPAGVTKASGLRECLAELGVSPHSTIGVGDAENDLSLLEACEVGVAVENAVAPLKDHAEVVTDGEDGEGVVELLEGPVLSGKQRVRAPRWRITLGIDHHGGEVAIPANQADVLIGGASGSGKSYVAGLLVEEVTALGYSVVVLDATGEHRPLGALPGVITFGGAQEPLPPPDSVKALLSHRFGSVVLDLSLLPAPARWTYVGEVSACIAEHRRATGLPHWVVLEEAHCLAGIGDHARPLVDVAGLNVCFVSYHPMELWPSLRKRAECVVVLPGEGPGAEQGVELAAEHSGLRPEEVRVQLVAATPAGALLLRADGSAPVAFTLRRRTTTHVRHQQKYAEAELPDHLRFFFSDGSHGRTPVAANIGQFSDVVASCDDALLDFHLPRQDFSRWIRRVLTDATLARTIEDVERRHREDHDTGTARQGLLAAVAARYLQPGTVDAGGAQGGASVSQEAAAGGGPARSAGRDGAS